jgi:glycosyltransferase involved in cell wall biosynthesis
MKEEKFNVLTVPAWNDMDLYSAIKILKYINNKNIDIIHAMHPRAHSLGLMVGLYLRNKPLIVTRRVSFQLRDDVYTRIKYHNKRITKFICVSRGVKEELMRFGIPEEKLVVIYSGVDTSRFFPRAKNYKLLQGLKIPDNVPLIGCIANFSVWKGQRILLEAVRILKQKYSRVHFVLAGAGNDTEPVTSWVREFGLSDWVTLLGFVNDVPSLMSALDIFVSPSVGAEGLSGTTREALAMAIPVIATDVGGNREIVLNMKTGILVPPSDPREIVRAIEYMLNHKEEARRMAEAGHKFVVENCSVEKMVMDTENLYQSVCNS